MKKILRLDVEEARQVLVQHYGGAASLEYTARVHIVTPGLLWDGQVHVFKIDGYPGARNASVWREQMGATSEVRVVPHEGGIVTAADAVRSIAWKTQA